MWKSRESRSQGNPAVNRSGGGLSEPRVSQRSARSTDKPGPVRINRAQLLIGGAVAFVLAGTTAFVFLREAVPSAPPAPESKVAPPRTAEIPPPLPAASAPTAPTPIASAPAPQQAVTPPAQAQPIAPTKIERADASTPAALAVKPAVQTNSAPSASRIPQSSKAAFTLQLGSFLVPENATGLIDRMTKRGDQAREKVETDESGKEWHKVRSGIYTTASEAQTAAEALKRAANIDALVVETVVGEPLQ